MKTQNKKPLSAFERFKLLCFGYEGKPENNWLISRACRACNQEILSPEHFAVWDTYWMGFLAPAHKACLASGRRQEAIELQKIDCSCNDCIFFQRGQEEVFQFKDQSVLNRINKIRSGSFHGFCWRRNLRVVAKPNHCYPENAGCFTHRTDEGAAESFFYL